MLLVATCLILKYPGRNEVTPRGLALVNLSPNALRSLLAKSNEVTNPLQINDAVNHQDYVFNTTIQETNDTHNPRMPSSSQCSLNPMFS